MEKDKRTILVVDDDPNNMRAIVDCFKGRFKILYANNGRQGYELAKKILPDIIIMDWAMPEMNGLDAILMLKSTDTTREIPIVMATAVMTSVKDLQSALEAGAVDFIRKPFDDLELNARTMAALRLSHYHQHNRLLMAKEQELLEERLAQKERELTLQAIQIHERNQFLTDMAGQMDSLEKHVDSHGNKVFSAIRKSLGEHLDTDRAWVNFLLHFESVHPKFFNGLKEDFPNLTNNELRLSAYIKIGMANKEMAQISGISLTTIKSNLNRLKKKMNLNANDSIRDFLIGYQRIEKRIPQYNSFASSI